jgi:hypothetical protein
LAGGVQLKNIKSSLLLTSLCLLLISGFVIICYDDDLCDTNEPPVIALRPAIDFYHTSDKITLLQLFEDSYNPLSANKNISPTRAPPA